ncbi:MAG: thioredoxin family protein [Acidobacteria bacterium]|nr:thioredoxin family protein [Acidobacteriota bacterium]
MRHSSFLYSTLLAASTLFAQQNAVKFNLQPEPAKVAPGKAVRLKLTAEIEKGWHLYSVSSPVTPTATRIVAPEDSPVTITRVLQQKVEAKYDPVAAASTESYEEKAVFLVDAVLKGDVKAGPVDVNLQVRSSACNDKICLPPRRKMVSAALVADGGAPDSGVAPVPDGFVEARAAAAAAAPSAPSAAPGPAQAPAKEGLWGFLLGAFGFGLAAIFTPCVFPMIPFTLSYFLNREGGLRQAAVFCLGIIVLFTAIGLLASALLGAGGAQSLSSNPWVNGVIGLVFFAFGLSMLGAFEITLPSGLLTKMNEASGGGGYVGSLLMGLTFSLTSFACVGPFMGTLLAASVTGDKLQPAMGMASFATGLASPFFLLAAFPSYLKKMPKSGGWLVRVKVVMAFFIFAMMIKYLSNVDLVMHWELLSRERFLALWVVLTAMPALYLLGWLRFEGIAKDEPVSISRLLLGMVILALSFFLLSGLFGAPLGEIDAYVPVSTRAAAGGGAGQGIVFAKNDLPGALARAKAENKLVFLNFTGYTCTNCKLMKANMFPRPEIAAEMSKFALVELYTDGSDPVSEENLKLQESTHKTVAIPYYVILDAEGKTLRAFPGLTRDPQEFLRFLKG